jgi:hypothetical protein
MKRTIQAWLPVLGVLLFLALCLAMTATGASAQAQGSGVIDGQVVNGTAGGPAIGAGITVTLYLFQKQAHSRQRQTRPADFVSTAWPPTWIGPTGLKPSTWA